MVLSNVRSIEVRMNNTYGNRGSDSTISKQTIPHRKEVRTMGAIHDMLKDIPIPRMVEVRQLFDHDHLEDVPGEVRRELSRK